MGACGSKDNDRPRQNQGSRTNASAARSNGRTLAGNGNGSAQDAPRQAGKSAAEDRDERARAAEQRAVKGTGKLSQQLEAQKGIAPGRVPVENNKNDDTLRWD